MFIYFYVSVFACVCVSEFVSVHLSISLCMHISVVYSFYFVCICLVSFLVMFQSSDKGNPLLLFPQKFLQKERNFAGHCFFRESNLLLKSSIPSVSYSLLFVISSHTFNYSITMGNL